MRLYNGCPDSQLAAKMKADADAVDRLSAAGVRATYFPMEGKWMVFTRLDSGMPHRQVTGFCSSIAEAAQEALKST